MCLLAGVALAAGLGPLLRAGDLPGDAVAELPRVRVRIGGQRLTLEMAVDAASRRRGLMFREQLPQGQGMLFVWPRAGRYGMWMKNTLIPLDVAFITGDWRILHIATMTPRSTQLHRAPGPVRYALEVNAGWFARHGIRVGDRIPGLETALPGSCRVR
ncbi:DUF192 domain-containing protein [Ectothiorhodospira mobilis]|uniref:DUF192 domain-containing protein n=1 Tax=Ectothiorhodospira mobilis TaxID=195064 RepID=UPI001F5B6930|nr:DUF192 domain-containing protein [Ectothiorhodospira mobilis]